MLEGNFVKLRFKNSEYRVWLTLSITKMKVKSERIYCAHTKLWSYFLQSVITTTQHCQRWIWLAIRWYRYALTFHGYIWSSASHSLATHTCFPERDTNPRLQRLKPTLSVTKARVHITRYAGSELVNSVSNAPEYTATKAGALNSRNLRMRRISKTGP